jgi:hypothetical protein
MNLSEGIPKIESQADVEAVLAQMARDEAKFKVRCGERDLEIAKTRESFKDVDKLLAGLANGNNALKAWGKANAKLFPAENRSVKFRHGTLRFRLGNPRLIPLEGWSLKMVLEKMQACRKRFGAWLKPKEDIDLQGLLKAARAEKKPLTAKFLATAGLVLQQDDAFSFELHQETPAP